MMRGRGALRRIARCALAAALVFAPLGAGAADGTPTLRVALTQEPGTLNPVIGSLAVESDLTQFLFDGLTRYDEHGNQVPDLAARVPTLANGGIARDGRTITYHLVHNARWHDGVALTSGDVAFTFAALTNPKNNVSQTEPYAEIARVETPDPYTVRIVLKRPWAPAINGFSDKIGGAIVPAHLLQGDADLNRVDFNAAPVGSGPYRFVAWHRGSDIVLEANPDYFRGPPKIPRVTIRFLNSDNTMLVALRTGELDIADRLNLSTYAQLGNTPGMLPAINAQSFWEHLTFNTARAPLDDVRVRRALCYGFDVHEIFAKVAHGIGALGPTNQNPLSPWYNAHLSYYPFDQARARALLEAAGWKLGADGVRVKNGTRLSITLNFPAGNITREQTGVLLQQRWQQIGVETLIKTFPPATFFAPAASGGPFYGGKTDVALAAFVGSDPDPGGLSVNGADHIPPHGNNLSFYANAELTRLEYAGAATPVFAARKKIYDRIQEIELRELPYYVIRWAELTDMRSVNLTGVKPPIVNSTFWNVADWTLGAETSDDGSDGPMKRLHALALGAAALGAGALPAMAQTATPLRVGGSYDEDYAEGFYAQDMGFFRAGGFDANVMPMKNGGAVIPALAGGALDVGIVNLASVSAAFARGLPLTVIAPCALYSSAFTTQAILVAPDSPIRTAKDLSGKKMGLTSLSSLLQVGVENWIDANGGSAADVQYLEVPIPEMVLAVKTGRVDAVGITEPWITQAKDQTRLLAAPFASIAKRFLITAWVANRQWVNDNPAAVKRFRAVIAQTAAWVNSHPDESATILSKYLGVPVATVAQMKRTQMASALDPSLIQPVIDAATRYKLVPQAFPAANMIAS